VERRTAGLIVVFSVVAMAAGGAFLMDRLQNRDEVFREIEGWPVSTTEISGYRPFRTYDAAQLEQAVSAIERAARDGVSTERLARLTNSLPQTIETPFSELLNAYVKLRGLPWQPVEESMFLSTALDSLLAYAGSPSPTEAEQAEVAAMVLRQSELRDVADRGLILRHLVALDQWEKHHKLPRTLQREDLPRDVRRYAAFARYVRGHQTEMARELDRRNEWTPDIRKQDPMTLAMFCGRRLANDPSATEWRDLRRTAVILNAIVVPVVADARDAESMRAWVNERIEPAVVLKGASRDLLGSEVEGLVLACNHKGIAVLLAEIGPELRGSRSRLWPAYQSNAPTFERINADPPKPTEASSSQPQTLRGSPRFGGGMPQRTDLDRVPREPDDTNWGLPIPETAFGP